MMTEAPESVPDQDSLSELARQADAAELAAHLGRRPELLRFSVVRGLAEAVRLEVRVDVEKAMRLSEAATAIARRLDEPEALGLAHRAKANALWFGGKLKPAVDLFHAAIGDFERAGNTAEVGRTLSSCIQPLILLGEYDQALQSAQRAREIFVRSGDRRRLGRLEINEANIHHRQDRFAEALERYQSAYGQLEPFKDQEGMAAALHNMAVCLIMLNDFDRALATWSRARDAATKGDMPLVAAQADYNIAYLYFLRGDYQRAIKGLRAAREFSNEHGNEYHSALCDLDESEIYLELNLSEEAGRMAARARERFDRLGISFEAGRALVNSAIALHQQRESAAALVSFAEAQRIFAREGNAAWQALVNVYRAMALWETGDAEAAAPVCRDALEFFIAAGLDRRAVLCHILLARISYGRGRFGEAREHCETALRKLAPLEAPLLRYHAHIVMGDIRKALGSARQSYPSYRQARRNLEALRSSLQGEELKIAFMQNRVEVYEKLVDLSLGANGRRSAEKAFRYMEKAKSRSLMELVYSRGSPLSWPGVHAPGERIARLRQELNWLYRRLEMEQTRAQGISIPEIDRLRAEARFREDELVRAMRELPRESEVAGDLDPHHEITLDEIRACLGGEATLLEYFQSGSQLIAAVLSRGELEIVQLGPAAESDSSIRMLDFHFSGMKVAALRRGANDDSRLLAIHSRLQELHGRLIAPLIPKLRGPRLIIVPHGVLHYVPFHALYDGKDHLIDRFIVSYAPSAAIYAICRRKRVNAAGPSLLLGVSDKRTPWIRDEIRSVAEVVTEPRVLFGRRATASALRSAGPSSRFIHIATHGTFRRDNPMFSGVRLADSYLNIYDLYELTLPVDLLTLSGCGTGLSAVAAGDELLGLIRGLIAAGAASLLLTLWDVHDRTTAQFMSCFYRSLQAHGDKGLALREAAIDVRKAYAHPYYWAPFVLVGAGFSPGN